MSLQRYATTGALAVALVVTGCRSTITGNEGNFDFSYVADDDVRNFNKPIAVGAKLDLKVAETGTKKTVALTRASSSADTILKAASFQGDTVVLEGTGSGSALITVEGTVPAGTSKSDSVNMLARVPDVLKLWHTCTSERDAQYLVGQDIFLPFDMEMTNGQAVIGYGYHPITVTPAAGLALDVTTKDQQFFHVKTAATKQAVSIASTLDTTTLSLSLIEAGDIDGGNFSSPNNVPATKVGATTYYHVLVTAAGKPVCQAFTDNAAASTAVDICTVTKVARPDNVTGPKDEYGWVKVEGKQAGSCTFDVVYAAANAGAGMTLKLTVPISAN